MKLVNGIWLPDEEEEVSKFVRAATVDGVGVYQYHKLQAALKWVKDWRCALDVGAHCGLWSMQLAKRFAKVYAFEPVGRHRECLERNAPTVEVFPYALGEKDGAVALSKGVKSTGDTCIAPAGEYRAEVRRLDSFGFLTVDFVKIDCEGYELFVLRGGEAMVERFRPPMIVEQKPGKAKAYGLADTEAVDWLMAKGYKLREVIAGDYILSV